MTPDNIVEIPWFSNTLPEGAFAVKDDLLSGGRRVVLSPLKRGEAVLRSRITGPGQRASLASLLDEGKRAVTVSVDDVVGLRASCCQVISSISSSSPTMDHPNAKAIQTFCWSM